MILSELRSLLDVVDFFKLAGRTLLLVSVIPVRAPLRPDVLAIVPNLCHHGLAYSRVQPHTIEVEFADFCDSVAGHMTNVGELIGQAPVKRSHVSATRSKGSGIEANPNRTFESRAMRTVKHVSGWRGGRTASNKRGHQTSECFEFQETPPCLNHSANIGLPPGIYKENSELIMTVIVQCYL